MDLKKLNEALNTYIRPNTFPVAIRLCKSDADLPQKAKKPVKDLGYQVTLCQAIGLARRYRWTLAVANEDQCCMGGAAAMGFPVEAAEGGFAPPGMAEKMLARGEYKYLLAAPLEIADFEPDAVVVYLDPAQANRLVQGISFATGKPVSAYAPGFADCGDVVGRTVKSRESLFILPSGGDRAFGGTQDHEVIVTIAAGSHRYPPQACSGAVPGDT
jgi:uncharacterized protein (DUF169 family)